jgi:hypothetical protein
MNDYLILTKFGEMNKIKDDPIGVMEICDDEKFIHPFEDLKQKIFFGGSKRKEKSFKRTMEWLKNTYPDLLL